MPAYFAVIGWRLGFMVGVSSSPPGAQNAGTMAAANNRTRPGRVGYRTIGPGRAGEGQGRAAVTYRNRRIDRVLALAAGRLSGRAGGMRAGRPRPASGRARVGEWLLASA
jgi:hypothetical protein